MWYEELNFSFVFFILLSPSSFLLFLYSFVFFPFCFHFDFDFDLILSTGLNVRGQGADGVTADSIPPSPFLLTSLHPFSSLPLFLSPFSADIFSPHSNWKNFLLPSDVTFAYNSVAPLAPNAGTGTCF